MKIINKSIIRIYPQDTDQLEACLMAGKRAVTIMIMEDEEKHFTFESDVPISFEIIGRILFSNKRFCKTKGDPGRDYMVLKVPGKYTEITDECFDTLAVFDEYDCTDEIKYINYTELYELCLRFCDPTRPADPWDVPNKNILRRYMKKEYDMEYVKFGKI